jgi:hypothetical protein
MQVLNVPTTTSILISALLAGIGEFNIKSTPETCAYKDYSGRPRTWRLSANRDAVWRALDAPHQGGPNSSGAASFCSPEHGRRRPTTVEHGGVRRGAEPEEEGEGDGV